MNTNPTAALNSFLEIAVVRSLCIALVVFGAFTPVIADENKSPDDKMNSAAIFNERIVPIFRSPNPSSCVQCHLSSVDLKDYILPSHEKTFVSLRDQGLVDMKNPKDSKILKLIGGQKNGV